ncbi:MAG: endolytic transglycosylase MltG [Oscillospiraceae bacterium]|nr:endolytic transglycosylase MltG [Oscillospiraceae bacterium]
MDSDTNKNRGENQNDDSWDLGDIMDILGEGKIHENPTPPASEKMETYFQPQIQNRPKTQKPPPPPPQNKPAERQKPSPGPVSAKPSPNPNPRQTANRPAGPEQKPPQKAQNIKEANMADEAQSGQTKKFDAARKKTATAESPAPDPTYHYTGRDIKSSRQIFEKTEEDEIRVSENREKAKNKRRDEESESQKSGSIVYGILKVVLYIAGVAVVSGIIAYNIIMMANDVFAFVKNPVEAVVLIPEGAEIPEIAQILKEKGIIKYPGIFTLYLNYRKKDKLWEYEPGSYVVSSETNYDDLLATFRKKAAAREIVRITIPEGYSIEEIISELVDNNKIGVREEFERVINEFDFSGSYRFLKPLYESELSPDRKYRLEGYLFPDTYDFYRDESELNIIVRFLDNFSVKFPEEYYKQIEILDNMYKNLTGRGMTIDDIISLASIVQWEAAQNDDFPKIAAVFHNRLTSPGNYPRLESDATVQYTNLERFYDDEKEKYRFKRPVGDELRALLELDAPYNTYRRNGLPPSSICNPGYEAISAALWPEENSPYYYFVANTNTGEVYYGRTSAEHSENINRARAGE